MRIYIGLDDTDTIDAPFGTGKLARWLSAALPDGCRCQGVVRQQLLVSPEIAYTSHNSAACILADVAAAALLPAVIDQAVRTIVDHAVPGSDPGLCVATESDPALPGLMAFGRACTHRVCTRSQATAAAGAAHLSGHGGTDDGIIGAAAAVGLTAEGWLGRYIELDGLRDTPAEVSVAQLSARGIRVMAVDRDAPAPAPEDRVLTNGWLRPMHMARHPVLLVGCEAPGLWRNLHAKKRKHGRGRDTSQCAGAVKTAAR